MKAIVQDRYGEPERVLRLADVDKPEVEGERVLVRVRASSVNAGDWRRVRANPFFVRVVEGIRRPKEPRIGGDAAGVVEAVGPEVADLKSGDEVFGVRTGAFAEYVSGKMFVRKPANLSFEEAAAVPVAGLTAIQAVRVHANVQPGQRVLVTGAGGGVGSFALQVAKAAGAEVTATTSTPNVDLMRSLGADHVVDYTQEDVGTTSERYDAIIDVAGRPSMGVLHRLLAPGGRLVRVGAGRNVGGPMFGFVLAAFRARVMRQNVISFIAKVNREDLDALRELIEAGKVKPVIDRTFALPETPKAMRYVETERARGKVIITV